MWEEIIRAIPVYFSSMLKFIFGPLGGYAAKLNIITTIVTTIAGTMTVVIAFTFFGDWLRTNVIYRFYKNRKRFSKRNRKFITIWRKYGLAGVAILTPVLLTPIGGSILAVTFNSPKDKLIIYMFVSAFFWASVLSVAIYFFGSVLLPGYVAPA